MPRSLRRDTGTLTLLFAVAFAFPIVAQDSRAITPPDSAQVAAALTMIELMHVGDDMIDGIEAMLGDSTNPNGMPQEYRQVFLEKARTRMPDFLRLLAPMYAARLTPEDIAQVSAFYRSPAAQHLMAAGNAIGAEMAVMGERWAYKVFGEMMIELGDAPPATPPASNEN